MPLTIQRTVVKYIQNYAMIRHEPGLVGRQHDGRDRHGDLIVEFTMQRRVADQDVHPWLLGSVELQIGDVKESVHLLQDRFGTCPTLVRLTCHMSIVQINQAQSSSAEGTCDPTRYDLLFNQAGREIEKEQFQSILQHDGDGILLPDPGGEDIAIHPQHGLVGCQGGMMPQMLRPEFGLPVVRQTFIEDAFLAIRVPMQFFDGSGVASIQRELLHSRRVGAHHLVQTWIVNDDGELGRLHHGLDFLNVVFGDCFGSEEDNVVQRTIVVRVMHEAKALFDGVPMWQTLYFGDYHNAFMMFEWSKDFGRDYADVELRRLQQ
mmetsp:Transcript_9292/g.25178  ORF Transcript_9292/g.25178 Transcript_9292/m.25178 type:complete len:319 (-) Transcript_9292:387-1343(-)